MSEIWYFRPANYAVYRRVLLELSPIFDKEGLSFHIARPDEEIPSGDTISGIELQLSSEGGC